MSTLTSQWVPVSSLQTADQIVYPPNGCHYVVLDVLKQPIGGWVVVAVAVDDSEKPAERVGLVFGNPVADALLVHREVLS